jgi:hypothetical protein
MLVYIAKYILATIHTKPIDKQGKRNYNTIKPTGMVISSYMNIY